jgi:acyl carrier protein
MIFEKIRKMMAEQLNIDPDRITLKTKFVDDLRIDSLDIVELLMRAEDEFGMEFDNSVVLNFSSVGDVVDYITNALKK